MHITWDEEKRRSNLEKHRLDFADVESVFSGLTWTLEDDRFEYKEQRFIKIVRLRDDFVVIAYSEEADQIRIISMRKATKYEKKRFFKTFRA